MGPLIPYVHVPELPLRFLEYIPILGSHIDPAHPPSIKPFGTLVAIGVYIGWMVAMRHAKQRGMSDKKMNDLIFWVVSGGFIGAHMLDAIFYHPDRLAKDPIYLFMIWDGLSSYGGFIGAVTGAFAWRMKHKEPILDYIDIICSAFPLAWVFGRSGCATVHDHPGRLSDAWFAVQWPTAHGITGRFDLGLYEMVLTIPLAIACAVLWHRKMRRPSGFYIGLICTAYAPVRFVLDFFRETESDLLGGDPRYAGLTPAQWACFGLLATGIYFLWRAHTQPEPSATPHVHDAGDDDDQAPSTAELAPKPAPDDAVTQKPG